MICYNEHMWIDILSEVLAKYGIEKVVGSYTLWNLLLVDLPKYYKKVNHRIGGIDAYYRRLCYTSKALEFGKPDWYVAHAKSLFAAAGLHSLYYLNRSNPKRPVKVAPKNSVEFAEQNLFCQIHNARLDTKKIYPILESCYGPNYRYTRMNHKDPSGYPELGRMLFDIVLLTMWDIDMGPYDWHYDFLVDHGDVTPSEETGLFMSWNKARIYYGSNGVHHTFRSKAFLDSPYAKELLEKVHKIIDDKERYKQSIADASKAVLTVDRIA